MVALSVGENGKLEVSGEGLRARAMKKLLATNGSLPSLSIFGQLAPTRCSRSGSGISPLSMTALIANPFLGCQATFCSFPTRLRKCWILLARRAPPFNQPG